MKISLFALMHERKGLEDSLVRMGMWYAMNLQS
jgi:hypothetical protein